MVESPIKYEQGIGLWSIKCAPLKQLCSTMFCSYLMEQFMHDGLKYMRGERRWQPTNKISASWAFVYGGTDSALHQLAELLYMVAGSSQLCFSSQITLEAELDPGGKHVTCHKENWKEEKINSSYIYSPSDKWNNSICRLSTTQLLETLHAGHYTFASRMDANKDWTPHAKESERLKLVINKVMLSTQAHSTGAICSTCSQTLMRFLCTVDTLH